MVPRTWEEHAGRTEQDNALKTKRQAQVGGLKPCSHRYRDAVVHYCVRGVVLVCCPIFPAAEIDARVQRVSCMLGACYSACKAVPFFGGRLHNVQCHSCAGTSVSTTRGGGYAFGEVGADIRRDNSLPA